MCALVLPKCLKNQIKEKLMILLMVDYQNVRLI